MDAAIIDLDGTVYRGGTLVPGAADGIEVLRAAGLDILFFSNNPIRDGESYASHLTNLGIPAAPDEACSAGVVTTEYLSKNHADDNIILVGAEGLREQLHSADLNVTNSPEKADVIVASWTPQFGYEDMQRALRAIDDDVVFLGTDPDRTFPREDGTSVPGSGAVIGAVAATVGQQPDKILGKPSDVALGVALERLGVDPVECLIVGDRLNTDLAMGNSAGMTTVLVKTGIASIDDIDESPVEPDYVIDSLADIETVLARL